MQTHKLGHPSLCFYCFYKWSFHFSAYRVEQFQTKLINPKLIFIHLYVTYRECSFPLLFCRKHNINNSNEWSNSAASLIVDTRQLRDWEQLVGKHVDLVVSLSASFMLTSFLIYSLLLTCDYSFMLLYFLSLCWLASLDFLWRKFSFLAKFLHAPL